MQLIFHTLFLSARLGSRWCQSKSPTRIVLADQNRQLIFYPSHRVLSSPAKMVWMRKAAADLPGPAEPRGGRLNPVLGYSKTERELIFSHPMVLQVHPFKVVSVGSTASWAAETTTKSC